MDNIFLRLKDTYKKELITRNCNGVTFRNGIGTLVEDGHETKDIEIVKCTRFTVLSFDLYLNKVIIACGENKDTVVSVQYSFLLENCLLEINDKNKIIDAVYACSTIKEVIDIKIIMYLLAYLLCFISGYLIGR